MSEYPIEVLVVLAVLATADQVSGVRLLRRWRFWAMLACICAGTLTFDGYLDARPVVLYGWQHLSGLQLWVVPIEDFGYGIALATVAILSWELSERAGRRRD
ncbi:MAG: lycopene cyclase domain-containing protein [Dehalococcoidia bacterium]